VRNVSAERLERVSIAEDYGDRDYNSASATIARVNKPQIGQIILN
jgi:hypothetical protein